jgi:putative ABC transport system ATP-binding protein
LGLYTDEDKSIARQYLREVGLSEKEEARADQLSGGQQQRVAIARALVQDPKIILADEPTGNLDTKTSYEIMNIFEEINNKGNTVIVVTHEEDIAKHAKCILRLRDGRVETDNPNVPVKAFAV